MRKRPIFGWWWLLFARLACARHVFGCAKGAIFTLFGGVEYLGRNCELLCNTWHTALHGFIISHVCQRNKSKADKQKLHNTTAKDRAYMASPIDKFPLSAMHTYGRAIHNTRNPTQTLFGIVRSLSVAGRFVPNCFRPLCSARMMVWPKSHTIEINRMVGDEGSQCIWVQHLFLLLNTIWYCFMAVNSSKLY